MKHMKQKSQKILVSFYSRTGNTGKVAHKIAKILKADLDEISDTKNRKGVKGWLYAGRDATKKNLTEIKFKKDPSKYDLTIVGTPIWAFTVTAPIRTYLTKNKKKFKNTAFFSTSAGCGIKRAFEEMRKSSDSKPLSLLALKSKAWSVKLHLEKDNNLKKIREFCKKLKK